MSEFKKVHVLGGGRGIAAAILAKLEMPSTFTAKAFPQVSENPPKVSRKERRALERSVAKRAKRDSK